MLIVYIIPNENPYLTLNLNQFKRFYTLCSEEVAFTF